MTWTTRTPTQPGTWWIRYGDDGHAEIAEITGNEEVGLFLIYNDEGDTHPLANYGDGYQWSSEPIKEPDNEL